MPTPHSARGAGSELALVTGGTLIRKTSLQDRTDNPLRSSKRLTKRFAHDLAITRNAGSAYRPRSCDHDRYSERSPLHDVRYHASRRSPMRHEPQRVHYAMKRELFSYGRAGRPDWWSQTGSNRRPPACKAGALPAELWPRKSVNFCQLPAEAAEQRRLVGLGRFELPTSRLSSARSNQLSYKPVDPDGPAAPARHRCNAPRAMRPEARPMKKEKRRRRRPANGTHD